MFGMGMYEMMIIGVVAIVLFGSKLPDVARSVGASYHRRRRLRGLRRLRRGDGAAIRTTPDGRR